jgi:serine/threonine protein kinase
MLEETGYLRLVDFGVCKRLQNKDTKAHTIVGTPEYLPPEIIIQKGHNFSADWWSFGVFM